MYVVRPRKFLRNFLWNIYIVENSKRFSTIDLRRNTMKKSWIIILAIAVIIIGIISGIAISRSEERRVGKEC